VKYSTHVDTDSVLAVTLGRLSPGPGDGMLLALVVSVSLLVFWCPSLLWLLVGLDVALRKSVKVLGVAIQLIIMPD
jgi:hypothetical protein